MYARQGMRTGYGIFFIVPKNTDNVLYKFIYSS